MKGSELSIGAKSKIVEFVEGEYALRLMDMGIRPGHSIELVRFAPSKGAAYIRTETGSYALRLDELDHILVA
ncbi:MAG: ferrous iron transport protein A [Flavobacteriales bacterium]|nr:ferrous iron transport protein A [Flavobacteriales bacterium]